MRVRKTMLRASSLEEERWAQVTDSNVSAAISTHRGKAESWKISCSRVDPHEWKEVEFLVHGSQEEP